MKCFQSVTPAETQRYKFHSGALHHFSCFVPFVLLMTICFAHDHLLLPMNRFAPEFSCARIAAALACYRVRIYFAHDRSPVFFLHFLRCRTIGARFFFGILPLL